MKQQKTYIALIVLLAASLLLGACGTKPGVGHVGPVGPVGPQPLKGTPPANLTVIENSGVLVMQEYDFSGFDKVEVSNGFDVEIKRGDTFRVVTNVEENLLPYVQVSLQGDTLKIGIDPTKTYHMINITKRAEVTLPELSGVEADFLSEVTVSGQPAATHTAIPAVSPAATTPPSKEEVQFQSGEFEIVGDLWLPAGGGKHPAIIMVHGDGPATRHGSVPYGSTRDIFLRHGYAVFSWDKPGSGASTGELDGEYKLTQRAAILADGIGFLAEHPAIDSTRIGLWGISQAGWVMPLALELTDEVAFLIVVSGGGEDSIEQMVYRFGQQFVSAGGSLEQADLIEQYGAQALKTTSYAEYREAMEALFEIPGFEDHFELEIAQQDEWVPWPQDIDSFIDPMQIIEHTTIPVLALFGEFDKDVDPVQGAEAYEVALQRAGNQDYQVTVITNAGHVFVTASKYLETLEAWLQHLSQ